MARLSPRLRKRDNLLTGERGGKSQIIRRWEAWSSINHLIPFGFKRSKNRCTVYWHSYSCLEPSLLRGDFPWLYSYLYTSITDCFLFGRSISGWNVNKYYMNYVWNKTLTPVLSLTIVLRLLEWWLYYYLLMSTEEKWRQQNNTPKYPWKKCFQK